MSRLTTAPTECLDTHVRRTCLEDGPIVLSERMDSVRSVGVGIWFRQGRLHESDEEQGISHLLEHMVFKGTHTRTAREVAFSLERLGGSLDAFTTHEATAFQARVPDHALALATDVLVDLSFQPLLQARDLEPERHVIYEELAAIEDTPEDLVFELHASFMYDGHPYGAPIIGTRESIGSIGRESLRGLHRSAYRPRRCIIAAAGRVDHDELLELVERLVPGDGVAGDPPAPPSAVAKAGERRVPRPNARQSHLVAGGLTVPYRDPLRYAIVLVNTALGGGMSSRLFQSIREERGLAYAVYSFHAFLAHGGHVGAYVGTSPETSGEARELLLEMLRDVAESGLSPDEIAATKKELQGRLLLSLETPGARMNRLAGLALYGQRYRKLDEIAERIGAITVDQVREAERFFHPDRLAVLELCPA
jgi:predicted Zn-dependent peptidase